LAENFLGEGVFSEDGMHIMVCLSQVEWWFSEFTEISRYRVLGWECSARSITNGAGWIDSARHIDVAQVEGARAHVAKGCKAVAVRGNDLPPRGLAIRE